MNYHALGGRFGHRSKCMVAPPPTCDWAFGKENLRSREPPHWCDYYNANRSGCAGAFVSGGGARDGVWFAPCVFADGHCRASGDRSVCAFPSLPPPSPLPTTEHLRSVFRGINARFRRGRPSTELLEAGVLVHMFDKQGLLNTRLVKWGRPGGGEFYSGSIIRTAKAFVWGGGDISGGFVLAPSTQILCAYDHDQGTDGQANGGCPIDHEWSGDDLLAVLEAGAPQTAYWINEIIVGGAAWERSLPGGVEAFFTSGGRGADQLRAAHRAFLEEHGLCASQACRGLGGLKRSRDM